MTDHDHRYEALTSAQALRAEAALLREESRNLRQRDW